MRTDCRPPAWVESRADGSWRTRVVTAWGWSSCTEKTSSWHSHRYHDWKMAYDKEQSAQRLLDLGYRVLFRFVKEKENG